MNIRSSLYKMVFLSGLVVLTQCGGASGGSAEDVASLPDTSVTNPEASDTPENTDSGDVAANPSDTSETDDADTLPPDSEGEVLDSDTNFLVSGSSLTDISGHTYEDEIRAVVDEGWWPLASTTKNFYPNSYLTMSPMVSLILKATGRYNAAVSYKGGLCPSTPTLSYAINVGILKYNACPSMMSYPTRNLVVKAMTRAFKLIDADHADFIDELVASYSGPSVNSYTSPYGVTRDYFKSAYELDALPGWSSSLSKSSTTYGASKTKRGETAAFAYDILGNDVPDSGGDPVDPVDPGTPSNTSYWKPKVGDSWYIQLQGSVSTSKSVKLYDIDLFDNSTSTISTLHSKGVKVVCYFSAGTYENWRPDASKFPSSVKGNGNGWAGESILDVRNLTVLGPIMKARMDLAVQKGCDGLDLDNMDNYQYNSGFSISYADQIKYNTYMANAAHDRGLSIGLKNDLDQIDDLVGVYDFAINEECYDYGECDRVMPFIDQGKAVLAIDYNNSASAVCPDANDWGFSMILRGYDLGPTSRSTYCWNY